MHEKENREHHGSRVHALEEGEMIRDRGPGPVDTQHDRNEPAGPRANPPEMEKGGEREQP